MNQDLYKNKLLVAGKGYEWSAHNWSGTDEEPYIQRVTQHGISI